MNVRADPFFSWTCLVPDEASYHFAPHTAWARESDSSGSGGHRIFVTEKQSAQDMPDLTLYAGVAALNCGGLSDRRLRDAGFTYVRRFAVLPSASNPRWFIPLDTPALSAAGFCLFTPFKPAAQLKHQTARTAARLGVGWWYRDRLCIALRTMPLVEQTIQDLLPRRPIRLAISAGTPPPAINRKISLAALAPGGRVTAFAKLPGPCALSERNVRREAAVLARLNRHPGKHAPQLLFADNVGAKYLAVMSPLRGRAPGLEFRGAHERFLAGLRSEHEAFADETSFVHSLVTRRALLHSRPALMAVLRHLLPQFRTICLPVTTVHGDFVPWNLRDDCGVISAFDWEYGEIDGLPLIDETHHLLAVGYLLHKWTPEHACRRLAEVAAAAPLGLPPATVRALHLAYLFDYLLRLFGEGHGNDYPRVAWCRQIVERLALPAVKGVAA